MEYPFFEVPKLGGGILIAMIAIFHVFIAHFAVGAGIFIAISHTVALRRDDKLLLRYLHDHSRFLVLFASGVAERVGLMARSLHMALSKDADPIKMSSISALLACSASEGHVFRSSKPILDFPVNLAIRRIPDSETPMVWPLGHPQG